MPGFPEHEMPNPRWEYAKIAHLFSIPQKMDAKH